MTDPDREALTPRLTATWSIHEEHAHQVSERCRAHAQACTSDVARSRRLRALSDVCEEYARAFRRWSTEDVAALVKMRERAAWSLVSQGIDEEMKP